MITLELLSKIYTTTDKDVLSKYIDPINKAISDYAINNPAMFIAQIGVESQFLTRTEENLNYSADRLLQVFPSKFKGVNVNDYARNPQKIANRVYCNRLGNSTEESGDGYRYRGCGAIQVTGKANYKEFSESVEMSLEDATKYMHTPEGAIESAAWFWDSRNCNSVSHDITATTKKINGGVNGLAERTKLYTKAKQVLA